jgi:hypothetical protein
MSKSISVKIPDELVWDQFKCFVQEKHKKRHTAMGMELQQALINHMNRNGNSVHLEKIPQINVARTHEAWNESKCEKDDFRASRSPKERKYQELLRIAKDHSWEIIDRNGAEVRVLHVLLLKRLIIAELGRDSRTIAKYLRYAFESTEDYMFFPPLDGRSPSELNDKELIKYVDYFSNKIIEMSNRQM